MAIRVITIACLTLTTACAALRGEGDPCTGDDKCPWSQVCCLPDDCPGGCIGTCRDECTRVTEDCVQESDCNDDNPCTDDACGASGCVYAPFAADEECETLTGAGGRCVGSDGALRCVVDVGQVCYAHSDCAAGDCPCVDPWCHRRECSQTQCSACQFVDPVAGCVTMPDGAPSPECAPFVCVMGGCATECTRAEDCAATTRCNDATGQCVDCAGEPGWCSMHRDPESAYRGIWAVGRDELWVVGRRHGPGGPLPTLFHWQDNGRTVAFQSTDPGTLHDVWADAATVWAVGETDAGEALAVRSTDSGWAKDPLPTQALGLRAVWCANGVVFAVGAGGTILRNGGFWQTDSAGSPPPETTVHAVWGNSSSSVWAGGLDPTDPDDFTAHVYKRDGGAWSPTRLGSFPGTAALDVWGTPSGALWLVGGIPPEEGVTGRGFVAAYDIGWDDASPPAAGLDELTLLGVWADDEQVWVVGRAVGRAAVFERRGTEWSEHPIPWLAEPTAVSASGGAIWVADDLGSLFRYLPP